MPKRASGSTSFAVAGSRASSATGAPASCAAPSTTDGLRLRACSAATTAQKRDEPAPIRAGNFSAARVALTTPSSEPPCRRPSPRASKQASPTPPSSTCAPTDSSRTSTRSQLSATATGSAAISRSCGARAKASAIFIPGATPSASAAGETSPTNAARPGSGARASGPSARAARPPAAIASEKRGSMTATTISERMFA